MQESKHFLIYEQLLKDNPRWALSEGSRHFEENSAVFQALHKVSLRLSDLGIPYAVIGDLAMFHYGYRRFTEDVNLLVTRTGLKSIHDQLCGDGFWPLSPDTKGLRDSTTGVRIQFELTGGRPGYRVRSPIVFPDPDEVAITSDGIRYMNLDKLVELKLASGMTNPGRLKDLADVLELIKALHLEIEFGDQLNPYVREKFAELHAAASGDASG